MSTQPTPGPGTAPPSPPTPPTSGAAPPKNGWMAATAGILTIIAGAIDILRGLARESHWLFFPKLATAGGILWIIIGIVALIGGIFALQKKGWTMALVGAICALLPPSTLLGILAIIFVAVSKSEFK